MGITYLAYLLTADHHMALSWMEVARVRPKMFYRIRTGEGTSAATRVRDKGQLEQYAPYTTPGKRYTAQGS